MVQRCNGTTAGLGYMKVNVIVLANLPTGRLTSVRTVDPFPIGENGSIPLLALTLTAHVNAATKQASLQTTSRPHHHAPLSKIVVFVKCTRLNTYL